MAHAQSLRGTSPTVVALDLESRDLSLGILRPATPWTLCLGLGNYNSLNARGIGNDFGACPCHLDVRS